MMHFIQSVSHIFASSSVAEKHSGLYWKIKICFELTSLHTLTLVAVGIVFRADTSAFNALTESWRLVVDMHNGAFCTL